MKTFLMSGVIAFGLVMPVWGWAKGNGITQEELVKRTQEIFDAVSPGDQGPWKRYFAEDCLYFDEKGRAMNKTQLVADVTPMPTGYSETIHVTNVKSHIEGNVAILSFDENETETVFGQAMTARYHETDTWMMRKGEWQIVAGQVLRYYEDPAVGKPDVSKFGDYVGSYELSPGNRLSISTDGKTLYRQKGDGAKVEMLIESGDVFFRKGVEGRLVFRRGDGGKVEALIDRRNNEDIVWRRVG